MFTILRNNRIIGQFFSVPYSFANLITMAVAYFGSSSMVRQMRSVCSQAMSVLPLPPNRSSTMLLGAELFLMGYASSGMGFIVGCSLLRLGLSKFQMVDCLRSANQRCFPLGSQPNSTGSCCH